MRVQCIIDLTPTEEQAMIGYAIHYGFLRDNPKKSWTANERKQAIRQAVYQLVGELLAQKVYTKT